jgi:hypothetical protein
MTHDHWLLTWVDTDNLCSDGGQQYISGCPAGTPWNGIFGSYFDPWFLYPTPENVAFPISRLSTFGYFRGTDVAYNATDQAFHVVWQAVPVDDPLNDESRSHIRMNTADSFIASYPAPSPYDNFVVSDTTGSCPPAPAWCTSDQDPVLPAIATDTGQGGLVVWEQLYPPAPTDHDIFGDLVQPVPEPGLITMLLPGVGLLAVLDRRRQARGISPGDRRFKRLRFA